MCHIVLWYIYYLEHFENVQPNSCPNAVTLGDIQSTDVVQTRSRKVDTHYHVYKLVITINYMLVKVTLSQI
jgi:hypothetical protein